MKYGKEDRYKAMEMIILEHCVHRKVVRVNSSFIHLSNIYYEHLLCVQFSENTTVQNTLVMLL